MWNALGLDDPTDSTVSVGLRLKWVGKGLSCQVVKNVSGHGSYEIQDSCMVSCAERIAIARALLRNPKVLLPWMVWKLIGADTCDSNSEKVVQAALDQAAKGRTTIATVHDSEC